MKKLMTTIIALTLAVIMAVMNPVKILASNTKGPVYLKEIKVGMGKSGSDAAKALEGYTIITDDKGNKVDFNEGAGGDPGVPRKLQLSLSVEQRTGAVHPRRPEQVHG